MRIIGIVNKATSYKLQATSFCSAFLAAVFLFSIFGCVQKDRPQEAGDYVKQSQEFYRQAVIEYKSLIEEGKDLSRLHYELGLLYYNHGDFSAAQENFRKSQEKYARKFLALSLYRVADFTGALEVFNKEDSTDGEFLFYKGLTCEKLNLFDEALKSYSRIKEGDFKAKAFQRVNIIERQAGLSHIKKVDPAVYELLAGAPSQEKYPQAGALILSCDERIEVTAQDTEVSYLHYIVKILNERGKEAFSETHLDYDSTYEKIELIYARTIRPDGRVVEVGSRHIRDVSKYLNFPLYSNARVLIISFPEIAEGASIEYKVRISRSQLVNKKDFALTYPLKAPEPVISAHFSISIPKTKPLYFKFINEKYNDFGAVLTPEKEEKDSSLIYHWHFKDIPQIIPEANMPPNTEVNPAIFASTFKSWDEVYAWWWGLAFDKIAADQAVKDKVRELTKNKLSEEEKARAIYNFCAQDIRYVAVEYGQAGYEPHKAADIFRNKYGDCKDQAILLVTMLREAGLSAWPLLIATKEYYNLNRDFPAIFFNHCIAALRLKEEVIFLDPTAETCSFGDLPAGDQDRLILLCKDKGYEILPTPLYPAAHNLVKQEAKIKLNPDETVNVKRSVFTLGIYGQAQRHWLLYTQPELIQEALKEKIQDISIGAKLAGYEIKNLDNLNFPVILNYDFSGPEYLTLAGDLRIMPQLASLDTSLVAKDKRIYAVDFNILDAKEVDFEIEIPENFSVKYMPQSISEESPWLKFSAGYEHKGNKIYFKQRAELAKVNIPAEEYGSFKKFFEGIAKKVKERIVLERVK